jgi:hypothetical protein
MKHSKRFIFLAKLGIIESTNKDGDYEVQRIDNLQDFKDSNELDFLPLLLENDSEAQELFKSLTHSRLESLNEIEINGSDLPESIADKLNSLDLRSDIKNGNILDCVLRFSGYVGNRPSDCKDKEHEDDTWAVDVLYEDEMSDTAYLYSSEYEYNQDYNLLKEFV